MYDIVAFWLATSQVTLLSVYDFQHLCTPSGWTKCIYIYLFQTYLRWVRERLRHSISYIFVLIQFLAVHLIPVGPTCAKYGFPGKLAKSSGATWFLRNALGIIRIAPTPSHHCTSYVVRCNTDIHSCCAYIILLYVWTRAYHTVYCNIVYADALWFILFSTSFACYTYSYTKGIAHTARIPCSG